MDFELNSTIFRVQFYSPHSKRIYLHDEGFSVSKTLTPLILQCYLKLYTEVCMKKKGFYNL